MIDNRHAVERLKHLEDQTIQTDLDSIENEQPLAFADIFPLSASNHKRGQSPERKFVVAFRNPTGRKNGEDRRSQEPDIEVTQEDPSTPQNDVRSSPRDNQNHLHLSIDSDAQSFGRSTSSHTTRMPRAGTRPTKEQATYRLILDVIPHEQADETFKSAQNMSGSTILEAKAEETIDKLMRNWTYVDPKYFSEDDGLSTSSIEPSLSSLRHKTPKRSPRERRFGPADLPSGLLGNSIERGSQPLESKGAAKELERSQSVSLEEGTRTPSSLAAGQNRDAKRRPSSLLPTYKYLESSRGAKDKSTRRTPSDENLENPKEPSTPAPPYLSSPSGSCSSCCTVAPSASISCADRHLCPLTSARAGGKEMGNEASASIDSALRLFESRMLEVLKDRSLQHGAPDRQLHHVPERQENDQQSLLVEQQAEPVILKDCLGRKFLFPFQTCRSWQVSSRKVGSIGSRLTPSVRFLEYGEPDKTLIFPRRVDEL